MAKTITTRYDVAEHLRTPEEMAHTVVRLSGAVELRSQHLRPVRKKKHE